jgi:hypothetical protein
MRVYEGVVVVDYGSAFVQSGAEADYESSFAGHANTLAGGADEGVLAIKVSSQSGYVRFVLDVFDEEPPMPDDYEDIVETRFVPLEPTARLCGFWGESVAEVVMTAPVYQARVASRGTADAWQYPENEEDEELPRPDEYLIQLWPSSAPAERIVKASPPAYPVPLQQLDPGEPPVRRALREADPRVRHEALIGLVKHLGSTYGIDQDPRFLGVIEDSREVLDQVLASGRNYIPFLEAMYDIPAAGPAFERVEPAVDAAFDCVSAAQAGGTPDERAVGTWHAWTAASNLLFAPGETPDYAPMGGPEIINCAQQALGDDWAAVETALIKRLTSS